MRLREMTRTLSKGIVGLAIIVGAFFLFSGMAGADTYTVTLAGDEVSDDPVYITPIEVTIEPVGGTEDNVEDIINKFTITSKSNFWGKERILQCNVIARNRKIYVPEPPPGGDPPPDPPPGPAPVPPNPLSVPRVFWFEPAALPVFATLWKIPIINAYVDGVELAHSEGSGNISFDMPYEGSDTEILGEADFLAKMYAEKPDWFYRGLQQQGMSEEEAHNQAEIVCNNQKTTYDFLVAHDIDPAVAAEIALDSAATAIDLVLDKTAEDGTRGTYYQTSDGDKFFVGYGNDPETGALTFKIAIAGNDLSWNLGGVVHSFDDPETEQLFETRKDAEKITIGKEKALASMDQVDYYNYATNLGRTQRGFYSSPGENTANSGNTGATFLDKYSAAQDYSDSPFNRLTTYTPTRNSSLIDRAGAPRNQQKVNPYLYTPPSSPISSPVLNRTTPKYRYQPNRNNTVTRLKHYQPRRSNWPPRF